MTGAALARLPPDPVRWWYAEAYDAECWCGPFASRGEAVADATCKLFKPGPGHADVEGFWVVSGALQRPPFDPPADVLKSWLTSFEGAECWFDDGAGLDLDEALESAEQPDGLGTVLAAAFEHWWVSQCDDTVSRMIEDFRTMDFFRRVRTLAGDTTELDPDRVP
jgi:hypothetical protein